MKRLFFGLAVEAPWPVSLPEGRVLTPECRHMTLAFLGNVSWADVEALLPTLPLPQLKVGVAGHADRSLLLPPAHPHVVAWHVQWRGEAATRLLTYQQELVAFLRAAGYHLDSRPFLPHVTMARSPFDTHAWRKAFHPMPMVSHTVHLYESVGSLNYTSLWSHHLLSPIEEISHTADVAFRIRAESMQQLGINAQIALCFMMPGLLPYLNEMFPDISLEDIVISLNDSITRADSELGCPLKAVSFHGDVVAGPEGVITWEMVVDV